MLKTKCETPNPTFVCTERLKFNKFCRVPGITFDAETDHGRSLAHQSFGAEADINNIMKKYTQTGQLVDTSSKSGRRPYYGEFDSAMDYHTAQIRIADAKQQFSNLPSHIRDKFNNNPENLLNFLSDPKNDEESVKMGLKAKPEPPRGAQAQLPSKSGTSTPSIEENGDNGDAESLDQPKKPKK